MINILYSQRLLIIVGIQLAFIIVANYFAFWLRFDGVIPHEDLLLFAQMLPSLILVRGAVFIPFRLYEGLWRYTSIWDLRNIIGAVTISSVSRLSTHAPFSSLTRFF